MPNTSEGITYPDSSGHTRIWEHLQTLASTVNTALLARVKAGPTVVDKRCGWRYIDLTGVNTDATGKVVVTHGAGFTPGVAVAVSASPSAKFAYVWGIDSINATTLTVRFAHPTSTAGYNSQSAPNLYLFLGE